MNMSKREKLPEAFEVVEQRLYDILLRSKLGQSVSGEECRFAEACWKKWPKEYGELQENKVRPEAFRCVNPFT